MFTQEKAKTFENWVKVQHRQMDSNFCHEEKISQGAILYFEKRANSQAGDNNNSCRFHEIKLLLSTLCTLFVNS